MTNEEKINLIGQKILILSNNLEKYQNELNFLKEQLVLLQEGSIKKQNIVPPTINIAEQKIVPVQETKIIHPEIVKENIPEIKVAETVKPFVQQYIPPTRPKQQPEFNFEQFIGGKLITIIGIAILVIGMGIGVKYAIDNDILGPLARIVLAYIAGGILLFIALRLKANYKAFSAVLLSGGMASLYFTTFIAYTLYGMFGQLAAFGIMVIFTMFTVFAATMYELEIIGIIGLVGAYAVPMLLSDGSGKIEVLFSYMAIVNIGILILSFKKYWQVLNHVAFGFTWLIVTTWFAGKYNHEIHTSLSLLFSSLFFIIFYISNISYKTRKQEKYGILDVIRIVANSFIYFGIGYATLNQESTRDYLGAFTLANAMIHLVFSFIVFKNNLLDRNLFYLLIALVLSFITIAVPVQLEGNWVTLLWAAEAVLLFSIGRYKAIRFYEWLGYIMILLSVFSLMQDWTSQQMTFDYGISHYSLSPAFANIYFFTSLFVIMSMGTMIFVHYKKALTEEEHKKYGIYKFIEYGMPILLFILTYIIFRNELSNYYQSLYESSVMNIPSKEQWSDQGAMIEVRNESILILQKVVLEIYNLIYLIVFAILAVYKIKTAEVRWSSFGLNMLISLTFITSGLSVLNSLDHTIYERPDYYTISSSLGYLRYICFALFAFLLYLNYEIIKTDVFKKFSIPKIYTGCIIHFLIIVILSNELIHLQRMHFSENLYYGSNAIYKLGFTSLWGIYSFALIAYGIFKKNKIMRVSAISLFGITLLKLLIFDTWDLSTGYKVIAYMLLGAILLVVAFLYQKFKVLIFGDNKN